MKDFDYQYQKIEKIKKMTAFLTVVIFLILTAMLYTGITYRSSKKETSTQEIAKVEKHAVKSISEDKKLEVGEESTINEGSYVSSDDEVATIDDSGKIIAKKEGFATIVGNNKEGSDIVVVVEVKGTKKETVTEQELEQPLQEQQPVVTQEEMNTVDNNIQTINEEPNTIVDTPSVEENVSETNQDVVVESNTENGSLSILETEEDITISEDTNTNTEEEKEFDNNISGTEKEETIDNKEEQNKTTNEANVNRLLKAAKEVTDYVRIHKFNYGNAPINPAINHNAKLVSCDRCVGWALYKIGYTDQPKNFGLVVHTYSLPSWLKRHNFTKIKSYDDLKKGDIVFFDYNHNNDPDHVFIIGEKKNNGKWERYDCGSVTRIRRVQPTIETVSKTDFTYAYRLPELENEIEE